MKKGTPIFFISGGILAALTVRLPGTSAIPWWCVLSCFESSGGGSAWMSRVMPAQPRAGTTSNVRAAAGPLRRRAVHSGDVATTLRAKAATSVTRVAVSNYSFSLCPQSLHFPTSLFKALFRITALETQRCTRQTALHKSPVTGGVEPQHSWRAI